MIGKRIRNAVDVIRRLGPVAPAVVVAAGLPVIGVALLAAPLVGAAPWIRGAGAAGVLLFAAGAGVLAGLSVVPMHLLAMLAGWTFGATTGIPTVFAGLFAAAALGYVASLALAQERVVVLLREHPRGAVVHRALVGRAGRAAFVVGLLRLSPIMPFAATNLVMAALHVPFGAFMLGTILGMIPRVTAGVLVGAGLTRVDFRAPGESWPALVGIAATLLALFVIGRIARRALRGLDHTPAAEPS